tara:strand:- start:2289 stop:2450 length:162 start_codon:yes stop_codon:yes gene_type:complete
MQTEVTHMKIKKSPSGLYWQVMAGNKVVAAGFDTRWQAVAALKDILLYAGAAA